MIQHIMRLPVCFVCVILVASVAESRYIPESWHPANLYNAFTNQTSQITNQVADYVKEKGRSIKTFYVENVKNRITSYFGNNDKKESREIAFNGFVNTTAGSQDINNNRYSHKIKYSCSDDPSVHMTTPQLIASNGYPAESHTLVTEDGYILTVHRIPYSKKSLSKVVPSKTVLLHHGLLSSSADWVIAGPEKGLPYILSEAGYDVWLANVRGNTYSRAHVSRSVDSFAFWNFTFHEVAQYDLPAVIDYIMEVKGWEVKINYIGHSMGTTVLFSLLSTKTQYNKVLRAGFALAPVAYMSKVESPIKLFAKFANDIEYLMEILGANEFLPQNSIMKWLSKYVCEINHYEEVICENTLFVFCGHDEAQFNRSLLPIILGHSPAGASTKTLIHYAQEIHNLGKFQQFDYGRIGNMKEYGTLTPPEYQLEKITLPIALLSAQNDWLASSEDVKHLYAELPNPIEHYVVPLKNFNHIDFLWAIDAPKLVYKKLLTLLEMGVGNTIENDNENKVINIL